MPIRLGSLTLLFLLASSCACASTYSLEDAYVGEGFLDGFKWFTDDDPTKGYVNYVSQEVALQKNLTYASSTKFITKADNQNIVPAGARGRDSVRIESKKLYTESLIVLDVEHMPYGCGQWPAFWTCTTKYPTGGEVDIIEGVNLQSANEATLWTAGGCTIPGSGEDGGGTRDCTIDSESGPGNGCATTFTKSGSYGASLNKAGGGYFAVTRSNTEGISMYFWARDDDSVPAEIKSGAKTVTPSESWGKPQAHYPSTNCNFAELLDGHNIIINLTFCGEWVSQDFSRGTCGSGSSCNEFVKSNPDEFKEGYWEINSLRVYTPGSTTLVRAVFDAYERHA